MNRISRIDAAVVGGGRWAGEHALTLLDVLPAEAKLHVCSSSNPEAWDEFAQRLGCEDRSRLVACNTIDDIGHTSSVGMVVVARRARDHAETAIRLLQAGKCVLIEKPFALTLADSQRIAASASPNRCAVSLPLLHAAYMQQFLAASGKIGRRRRVNIIWSDAMGEVRRGRVKRHDPSVSVILDVFPHIWSIIAQAGLGGALDLNQVFVGNAGADIEMQFLANGVVTEARMTRNGSTRMRVLSIQGEDGEACIDFSEEPGHATVAGMPICVSSGFSSPLRRMLQFAYRSFLNNEPLGLHDVRLAHRVLEFALEAEKEAVER